jgi:hypothetical protein
MPLQPCLPGMPQWRNYQGQWLRQNCLPSLQPDRPSVIANLLRTGCTPFKSAQRGARASTCRDKLLGRPSFVPFAFAAFSPAVTLSLMMLRSNSAIAFGGKRFVLSPDYFAQPAGCL